MTRPAAMHYYRTPEAPMTDTDLAAVLPTGRDTVPLHRARRHLADALPGGTSCPVCGQHAELYRRRISPAMVRDLTTLYRHPARGEFVHVPSLGIKGGDFAKLREWGLIAEQPAKRGDGGRAGYWKITADGAAFVEGRARVPEYVLIYDGRRVGYDGDPVGIDSIVDGFDLRDIAVDDADGVRDDDPPVTALPPEAPGTPDAPPAALAS